jgi:hypothetical protein
VAQIPLVVPPVPVSGWQKSPHFLFIKGVTKDDLKNGTGIIEKLKYPPWDSRNNTAEKVADERIGYGKYASMSYSEVSEKDPRYFTYMCESVPRFKLKAAQLGLID